MLSFNIRCSSITQWLAACEGFLIMSVGMATIGWTPPFIGHLSRPNPPFEVTPEQITWIASIVSISRLVGNILIAIIINHIGSKMCAWLSGVIFLIGWLLMIFASNFEFVFISLIFNGIGIGAICPAFNFYISEIAKPDSRGTCMGVLLHGTMVGVLFGNLTGTLLPLHKYAMINIVMTIIFLVSFYYFPHSPHYLVRQNKMTEAQAAIHWYDHDVDAVMELQSLKKFLDMSPKLSILDSLRELTIPPNRRILLILSLTYGLIQFSGVYTILEYSEIIFIKANVTVIKPSTLVSIMTAMGIPTCWLAMWTTDRFGRTTVLSVACLLFSVALTGWAINFHLLDLNYNDHRLQWIVIVCTVVFRISHGIGLSPILPLFISELFAPNVKYVGDFVCNFFMALCRFISMKNFQIMVHFLSYKYVFYMFAIIILIVRIISKRSIPETKGKSLAEIQTMLRENEFKKST